MVWLLIAAMLGADAPGELPEATAAQVRRLVRQLNADELAQREAAEKELLELGPAILVALPPITNRTPAELRDRLDRVRRTLERIDAENTTRGTTVTLAGKMKFADALAAIEQQTGNKPGPLREGDRQVDTDFENTPYWQAIDALLDQTQLTVNPFGGQFGALTLSARPAEETSRADRAVYQGPFRVESVRIRADRDLRNPSIAGLRLTLDVAWEPRLTPISLELPLAELHASDEQGRALSVDGAQASLQAAGREDICSVQLEAPLALAPRDAWQLASLRGTLYALIPSRTERFEFADLEQLKDEEQRRAGVTVTFVTLRKNRQLTEAHVRIRFDKAANALESHRGWVYNNQAYLLDKAGQRVENAGFEANRQEADEVGIAYRFVVNGPLDGYRFVYETPAALIKLPVEFTLTDIPLP